MTSMLEQANEQKTKVSLADAWEEFRESRDWELSCPISWTLGPHGRGATLAIWWGNAHENPDENGIAVTVHYGDEEGDPPLYCEVNPTWSRQHRWSMEDIIAAFGVPADAVIWDVDEAS